MIFQSFQEQSGVPSIVILYFYTVILGNDSYERENNYIGATHRIKIR